MTGGCLRAMTGGHYAATRRHATRCMDRPNVAVTPRRSARGRHAPPGASGCGERPSQTCMPQMLQGQG